MVCSLATQERTRLEDEWQQKLQAAEQEAKRSKQATEAKVAGIIGILQQLAEKEAKREQQRSAPRPTPLNESDKQSTCRASHLPA